MSSSMGLLKRKSMVVSKQVGQSSNPSHLLRAGGPGDLQASTQKSNYPGAACYTMGRLKNRTAYKNNKGVDRKHGSYHRFLARRVGGVLREEQMPRVINRTAFIGQPCRKKTTLPKCALENPDPTCCKNRIPAYDSNAMNNCYVSPSAQRTCVVGRC